jgi:hypothetical protein
MLVASFHLAFAEVFSKFFLLENLATLAKLQSLYHIDCHRMATPKLLVEAVAPHEALSVPSSSAKSAKTRIRYDLLHHEDLGRKPAAVALGCQHLWID